MTEDAIRVSPRSPGDRAGHAVSSHDSGGGAAEHRGGRRRLPVPTELIVLAVTAIAVLIAAANVRGFDAHDAWTLVTVLAAAYIVSRGLAKLGRGDMLD